MEVILHILQPRSNPPRVHLKGTVTVGRSPDCQLRLSLPEISRRHCLLTLTESELLVRDLGSSNGTRVDGKPIPHGIDQLLRDGMHLEIGPLCCRVEIRAVADGEPATLVDGLSETHHHLDTHHGTPPGLDEDTSQTDRSLPSPAKPRQRQQDSGESSVELPAVDWNREDFGLPSPAPPPSSTVDNPDLDDFLKKLSG